MMNNLPNLLVATVDHAAIVKVTGRANFSLSVSFKHLVGKLQARGSESFVLDLSECVTMDSTFLGVLAGTALRLAEPGSEAGNGAGKGVSNCPLCLLNPNPRVTELLDNLGISELFRTVHCAPGAPAGEYRAPTDDPKPSREELSLTCLEAHQLLMDLNPQNIPKFKEVTQFLAEDLKKQSDQSEAPAPV